MSRNDVKGWIPIFTAVILCGLAAFGAVSLSGREAGANANRVETHSREIVDLQKRVEAIPELRQEIAVMQQELSQVKATTDETKKGVDKLVDELLRKGAK